ncbi:SIS domain-containing protein [Roseomonas sp. BN140053]|uniref:SIS domain-containing protein n=1 Tax=Roseomonas sp. BN140053 TaxID=3391898 RepID=UPI0039E964A1
MTDFSARTAALTAEPSRDDAHDPARLARVGRTREEMLRQGAAVSDTLAREAGAVRALAGRIAGRGIERVVIAGCGDSWFCGAGVRHAWELLLGWPTEAAQALDYACYGAAAADRRTLVLGLSSGGNTPAVMKALAAARARGAMTVGVSNTAGSPVLAESEAGLVVHATRKGWPTQSSTATMALLAAVAVAVADALGRDAAALRDELARLPNLLDAVAAGHDAAMRAAAEDFAAAQLVLFTGLGPNGAAASFGAAKLRELSPIHAVAQPLEEMHHYRAQKRGDPLLLIATDPASRERALDTVLVSAARGGRTVALLAAPDAEIAARAERTVILPAVHPALAALVSSVPLHLFAFHFATARDALGLGYPGAFPGT